MKRTTITDIICFLFILLFVYAALSKMQDMEKFKIQIGQSPLLYPYASWIVWIVPVVEITIAIIVAVPSLRLKGLYLSYGLMVMFTAYIIAILNFNGHVPCACGGIISNLTWREHLIFNIVFVLLSITGIVLETLNFNKSFIAIDQDKPKTCIRE